MAGNMTEAQLKRLTDDTCIKADTNQITLTPVPGRSQNKPDLDSVKTILFACITGDQTDGELHVISRDVYQLDVFQGTRNLCI